ncbi:MAG: metallophosphoesterase [Verrucomicrobiales bacterium]|nr:metallophosphoesterase [Verrucomicrobiales bacterium]
MIRPAFFFAALVFLPVSGFAQTATGFVFEDKNRNGARDDGEPGIAGVAVSNRKEVVQTDADGKWSLPHDDDTIFFVVKPEGWKPPVNENQLPQFFYIHKPAGSRTDTRYAGVAPTGPLPDSIDFPLTKAEEPEKFRAIFFGDPQPSNIDQVDCIAHDVLSELIGTDARFGVTLGDIMFDNLSLFDPSNANIALIGIPWYNVIGNHDLNFEADLDSDSDETFHRYFGPQYYSFDYGAVHFIVLDDVDWGNHHAKGRRTYKGGLGPDQIAFVKNDLALVPEKKLVCLLMHIPLINVGDRQELYRLIEKRPYTMSISGHTHWHAHEYIGKEDGWQGDKPHHHIVNVTVSGSWWKGRKNELGIPHATMRDGAPNGYSIITFDGVKHTLDFKAAGQPVDYQMSIYAPDEIESKNAAKTPVYVNLFNGSEKSEVKMRLSKSADWIVMKQVREKDPHYTATRQREIAANPGEKRQINEPVPSSHLWKANLPADLHPGSHLIEIEGTDAYGRAHQGNRILRVVE